jgi:hypothetical protein
MSSYINDMDIAFQVRGIPGTVDELNTGTSMNVSSESSFFPPFLSSLHIITPFPPHQSISID